MNTKQQTERPTPITDAKEERMSLCGTKWVPSDLARDLERRLAEAREGWADEVRKAQSDMRLAEQMLDKARAQRDEAREQRDRLAEALPVAMARAYAGGYQHGHEDTVEAQFVPVHQVDIKDYFTENVAQMPIDGSQPEAASALAAVKGGQQ